MWGNSAQSRSKTGVSAIEIALPGPDSAMPQPSRMTSATEGTVGHYPAASTIAANSAGSRLAPPTRAPSMSGWAISSAALSGLTEPP